MCQSGASWMIPGSLKVRLLPYWTRCLELLANCDSFALTADTYSIGQKSCAAAEDIPTVESWELVLSILTEEEAVEQDGEIKLLPVFLSLPLVLQLRFLHFLHSNILRASSHSVIKFLLKIDNLRNNLWTKEVIQQIKNSVCNNTDQDKTRYEFTSTCQSGVEDIVNILKNGETRSNQSLQKYFPDDSADNHKKSETRNDLGNAYDSKKTDNLVSENKSPCSDRTDTNILASVHHPDRESSFDVIIIDDDSIDDPAYLSKDVNSKSGDTNFSKSINVVHYDERILDRTGNKRKVNSAAENSRNIAENENSVDKIKKVKSTEHTTCPPNDTSTCDKPKKVKSMEHTTCLPNDSSTCDKSVKELKRRKKKLGLADIVDASKMTKLQNSPDKAVGIEPSALDEVTSETKEKSISLSKDEAEVKVVILEKTMAYLETLRDACSTLERGCIIDNNVLNVFMEMSVAETKAACSYLSLHQFSETALVNFCDNIPCTLLDNEVTEVILHSCFSYKLQSLESQVSRTMLMCLSSLSRIHPRALINVLANVLQVTQSGKFQCQLLTSVCKELLPSDSFCYLVRQLSIKGLVWNENLAGVLQIITDKTADLDPQSWSCFHSLLASAGSQVSSSAKFGKLLMAVLTKYGKKMSSQQFTTIYTLADTHNSSLRKPILAVIRRMR